MFLDLWSLAILTRDLLELIVNQFESGTLSVSFPFVLFLIFLSFISLIAWKSTNISDLPPVPRPPYVIQISGTPSPLNNGERNALADVRLLSSHSSNVESVFRRFPSTSQNHNHSQGPNRHRFNISVNPSNLNTRTTVRVYPQSQQGSQNTPNQAVLLGLVRPRSVILPFRPNNAPGNGGQSQNVIVYHRVNVYHHHHHHSPNTVNSRNPPSSQLSAPISTRLTGSISVDSSTQYEREDTSVSNLSEPFTNQIQSSVEVSSPDVNIETEEGEIILESEENPEDLSNQSPLLQVETEELSLINTDSTLISENSTSDTFSSQTTVDGLLSGSDTINAPSSSGIMDVHQRHGVTSKADGFPQSNTSTESGENDIRFIIKFLNDTQMDVRTQVGEKVADFKRRHFSQELSENKTVRLIFNGRVLDNPESTLRESGIFDQCVVHCLIVARPTVGGNTSPNASSGSTSHTSTTAARQMHGIMRAPEPGMFFVAFVGVFLIFLWFICFHFGQHLFTQSAVVSLTVLTAIFLIGLVAFYLPVHPNQ